MSDLEITIRLTAVAVLASFLFVRHYQRARRRYERYDAPERAGKPIDATQLEPAVTAVRRDYLATRRPARGAGFHTSLLGLARRAVTRLAYFQDRQPDQHPQTHGS